MIDWPTQPIEFLLLSLSLSLSLCANSLKIPASSWSPARNSRSSRTLVVILGAGQADAAHATDGLFVGAVLAVVGANLVALGLAEATVSELGARRVAGRLVGEPRARRLAQQLVLVQLPSAAFQRVPGARLPGVGRDQGGQLGLALFANHLQGGANPPLDRLLWQLSGWFGYLVRISLNRQDANDADCLGWLIAMYRCAFCLSGRN